MSKSKDTGILAFFKSVPYSAHFAANKLLRL